MPGIFHNLRYRLAIIYGLSALLVFSVAFVVIYFFVNARFENYLNRGKLRYVKSLPDLIREIQNEEKDWDMTASILVLRRGVSFIKLEDAAGNILMRVNRRRRRRRRFPRFDRGARRRAREARRRDRFRFRRDSARRRPPRFRPKRSFKTVVYKYKLNSNKYGKLHITYRESHFFTLIERIFLSEVKNVFLIISIIAVLIFILLAFLMARTISLPIIKVVQATKAVADGNLQVTVQAEGITELEELAENFNRMAESLDEKETLQKKMTSDVAHELRTPLTILKSHLEGMSEGVLHPDQESLSSLLEEANRLEHIIDDLKAIWDLEKRAGLIEIEELDVIALSGQVFERFKYLAEDRKVKLEYEHDEKSLLIMADRDAYAGVLVNIVSNGLRYTTDAMGLKIARVDGKNAEIIICDNGPGIPEKDLPFIFERFYRIDESRNRSTGGAGLGLAIARQSLQAMGGSIKVVNRPEGGCCFHILLPLYNG